MLTVNLTCLSVGNDFFDVFRERLFHFLVFQPEYLMIGQPSKKKIPQAVDPTLTFTPKRVFTQNTKKNDKISKILSICISKLKMIKSNFD